MAPFIVPPPLRPGDRVAVIAPSSPFDRALFFRGVGWLAERYRVRLGENVLRKEGFLAGPDEARLADLNAALQDPEVRAIVAARGGHGAVRIVHRADWECLTDCPKWIVGFSDVTLLHAEAWRLGICSLHAENAAGLGRGADLARAEWVTALEHPARPREFAGLQVLRPGEARGPLIGGNLTLLFTALACGRLRLPEGAILALEDVTETSYRIDRMLSALHVAGVFKAVAGVVFGDFTDCSPGPQRVPVSSVLLEHCSRLDVPVLGGLPFGHGAVNHPLHLGFTAQMAGDTLRLG